MLKWEICGVPICHNYSPPGYSPAAWSAGAGETTSAFLNTETQVPCTSLCGQHPQHKNQLKTPVLCCLIRKCIGNICLHAHGLRGTQFSALTFTLSQTGEVSLTLPTVGGGPCGGISGLEITSLTPGNLFLPLGSWQCTLEALLPPGICWPHTPAGPIMAAQVGLRDRPCPCFSPKTTRSVDMQWVVRSDR